MNTNREDLIERYQQFSDEELLKLFRSGNLTELAKSVALKEIKTRRLVVPSLEFNSIDKLLINMKTIALNLSFSEADELSEIMKSNGIPVLIDKVSYINKTLINNKLYQLSVPSMHVESAMGVINSHLNKSSGLDQYLLSNGELNTGINDDVAKHNKEIRESNLIDDKSENVEAKTVSSNTGGQLFKLYVVIFFIAIDWISLKLFDFSFLHFFHIYK